MFNKIHLIRIHIHSMYIHIYLTYATKTPRSMSNSPKCLVYA